MKKHYIGKTYTLLMHGKYSHMVQILLKSYEYEREKERLEWCGVVHGCMVYTDHAEIAAVPCGTSHVTTKQHCRYTTVDIKACYGELQSLL